MPLIDIVDRIPALELAMWHRWLQEPRGDRRADWHAGMLAKAVHDVAMGFNGKSNPAGLETYLLRFEETAPEDLTRRNMRAARALFGAMVPTC